MSKESQIANMKALAKLLKKELGFISGPLKDGPNGAKRKYLSKGRAFLTALGKDLGFSKKMVRVNSGEIALSGDISLKGMWSADNGLDIKKSELQFAGLSLNRVAISLNEYVKTTGELKSVFKFTYNGKPYTVLSRSEKIKAGLEVSVLIQRLLDFRYPVFIDDTECIEAIDNVRPSGQCIVATMVKGTELCVEPVGQQPEDTQQKNAA